MTIELAARERTLPALLRRQAEMHGDRPLMRIAGGDWSHRDAIDRAARRGAALHRAGVRRGERVAPMCSNRVEFVETFLGCGWIGAVAVPINTASMEPQIEYVLVDSGARLLVIDDRCVERLATADLSRTRLDAVWMVGESNAIDVVGGISATGWPFAREPIDAEDVRPGDTLAILYTSGTTGPAKGVMCPHAQYHWWGINSRRVLELVPDDVLCTTLPLFHINALNTIAQAAVTGACATFEQRFSVSAFWTTIKQRDATVVYLLGAMVPMLLARPSSALERDHRVRICLGPGVPRRRHANSRSEPASPSSTVTARRRPIS